MEYRQAERIRILIIIVYLKIFILVYILQGESEQEKWKGLNYFAMKKILSSHKIFNVYGKESFLLAHAHSYLYTSGYIVKSDRYFSGVIGFSLTYNCEIVQDNSIH